MAQATGRGTSVRIYIPSGDPDRLRLIEKANWTGHAVVFPRALLAELRARREASRAGVYILWGGVFESDGLPMIYIGEADPVGQRLTEHARVKDFWTQGVVFTSKDDALNKAYIKHLESRLITLAQSAKRCVLDNGNSPELPSLSEADRDDAEGFLADMLLLLPLLGIPFFESAEKATATTPELHLYGKNVSAHAVETPGGFVVLKGSLAVAVEREANSTPQRTRALRQELIHNGVLARAEEDLVFTQDYVFSSPSAASDVILGTSSSGPELWKDGQGQSLKEAH